VEATDGAEIHGKLLHALDGVGTTHFVFSPFGGLSAIVPRLEAHRALQCSDLGEDKWTPDEIARHELHETENAAKCSDVAIPDCDTRLMQLATPGLAPTVSRLPGDLMAFMAVTNSHNGIWIDSA
jgi:hypothetical protein